MQVVGRRRRKGHPISSEKTLLEMLDKLQIEGPGRQCASQDTVARRITTDCMTMGKVEAGR